MALNSLICVDVSLRIYSLIHLNPIFQYLVGNGVCNLAGRRCEACACGPLSRTFSSNVGLRTEVAPHH